MRVIVVASSLLSLPFDLYGQYWVNFELILNSALTILKPLTEKEDNWVLTRIFGFFFIFKNFFAHST